MHILQPKHIKLKADEVKKILDKYNISVSQLPKIKSMDPAIVNLSCVAGDVLRLEREDGDKIREYYRVVA